MLQPGLESAGLEISGGRMGWHVQIILARFDPDLFFLRLQSRVIDSSPAWTIDSSAADTILALNAGQFEADRPWGWIVSEGKELQPPRYGPLSSVLVVDASGRASIADASETASVRAKGSAVLAFQSYPAILTGDGVVPEPLRIAGSGVDLEHRDSRLALGLLRDGRLLAALTRFGAPESALARLPFGPTTPEMAAIMGALGCRRAMLLDGGLSGQMMMRDRGGRILKWPGLRSVPMGLEAGRPRPSPASSRANPIGKK